MRPFVHAAAWGFVLVIEACGTPDPASMQVAGADGGAPTTQLDATPEAPDAVSDARGAGLDASSDAPDAADSLVRGPGVTLGSFTREPASRPWAYDFLTQEVCVGPGDVATADDPYGCPTTRKLRIGEDLPYVRTDFRANQAWSWAASAPHLLGAKTRVLTFKEFGQNSWSPSAPRAYRDFDPLSDGFDDAEADGDWVSLTGTRDPNTTANDFRWWNQSCAPEDGWLLFPNQLGVDVSGSEVARLRGGSSCNLLQGTSSSLTIFHRYTTEERVFTSNKKMEAIVVWHYGGSDTSKNLDHIEQFYFTRPYGFSRWERWERDPAKKSGVHECNGDDTATFFNQDFYRSDCRDWTYTTPLSTPLHPYFAPMNRVFHTSRNLLASADFAGPSTTGWDTTGTLSEDPVSRNVSLKLACSSTPCAAAARQKVSAATFVSDYGRSDLVVQAGALVQGPPGARAKLEVRVVDSGQTVTARSVTIRFTDANVVVPVRQHFDWTFGGNQELVYELILETPHVVVLDETFMALLPR